MHDPVVIGFDTATEDTAVAATAGDDVLFEAAAAPESDGRPLHAATLLPQIDRAVEAAGGWERVGRLAVGIGPGSFTGLRIGIATARALAQSLELPLVPVGTLEALGQGILVRSGGRPALAVID